jgi:protocatechuate 3,4-dioxygenase beta subunit
MGILLRIVIAALLLQTAAQPQTASVEGRVISPAGAPVPRADVSLIDPAARITSVSSVTADTEGRFVIAGIKPGVYKVRASRDGFTTVEYGQKGANGFGNPFTLAAGQNLKTISITVVPKGAITGRILDRDGVPVVRVGVQALKLFDGDPIKNDDSLPQYKQ